MPETTAKYKATDIASWFLSNVDRDSGDSITHLKLQKLVYYAQAWSLALFDRPLFDEDMEAWAHGPVARSVWNILRERRWEALGSDEIESNAEFDEDTEGFLQEILDAYGSKNAKTLEAMTHKETPWIEARDGLPLEVVCNNPIRKDTMAAYYKRLYEQSQHG